MEADLTLVKIDTKSIKPTSKTIPDGQFSAAIFLSLTSKGTVEVVVAGIKLKAIDSSHFRSGVDKRDDSTFWDISDWSFLN